jgi:[acyl-carrier-protein] S-malonyltransferase
MRAMLLDSFVKPLRWPRVVDALKRQGVGHVCVCGPDSLFGRVRCTTGNFEVLAVNPGLALMPPRRRASA